MNVILSSFPDLLVDFLHHVCLILLTWEECLHYITVAGPLWPYFCPFFYTFGTFYEINEMSENHEIWNRLWKRVTLNGAFRSHSDPTKSSLRPTIRDIRWQDVVLPTQIRSAGIYEQHSDRVSRSDKFDVGRGVVRRIHRPSSKIVGRGRLMGKYPIVVAYLLVCIHLQQLSFWTKRILH